MRFPGLYCLCTDWKVCYCPWNSRADVTANTFAFTSWNNLFVVALCPDKWMELLQCTTQYGKPHIMITQSHLERTGHPHNHWNKLTFRAWIKSSPCTKCSTRYARDGSSQLQCLTLHRKWVLFGLWVFHWYHLRASCILEAHWLGHKDYNLCVVHKYKPKTAKDSLTEFALGVCSIGW